MTMNYAPALEAAISATKTLISTPGINATALRAVYDSHFGEDAFPTSKAKSRPQFSEEMYPRLPIDLLGGAMSNDKVIPKWDCAKELLALAAKDDSILARILAAYIWKRGELGRVRYVPDGILSARTAAEVAPTEEAVDGQGEDMDEPVVMWQFGRHLASATEHPIFDQHTYRAFNIFVRGVQIPRNPQLRFRHLKEYLHWWATVATKHLPIPGSADRSAATYELDKLLFSVGKAALLCPECYQGPVAT